MIVESHDNGSHYAKEKGSFEHLASLMSDHYSSLNEHISNDEKLQLYGLYKRVTVGNAPPKARRPSIFYAYDRAKFDAWKSCEIMTSEEAKQKYVSMATYLLNRSNIDIDESLLIYCGSDVSSNTSGFQDDLLSEPSLESFQEKGYQSMTIHNSHHVGHSNSIEKQNCIPVHEMAYSYFNRCKILPRGRLDISFRDLLFAFRICILYIFPYFSDARIRMKCEKDISKLWHDRANCPENEDVLISQSIRSAFDLYLQARNFPPGSEIIMTSIQIEGMVRLATEVHRLKIIPVDCSIKNLAPSMKDITSKITENTVAVLIVHAFGAIGGLDMKELSRTLKCHEIDLIEDCAECFSGIRESNKFKPFVGSKFSDIVFFSFGTIKTATALGGGITLVRKSKLAKKMKRLQNQYDEVSNASFLYKVVKSVFLLFVCRSQLVFGVLVLFLDKFNFDYEKFITKSLRGFKIEDESQYSQLLIPMIRRKISLCNIVLLHRRLSTLDDTVVYERIRRCEKTSELIKRFAPHVTALGQSCGNHLYWQYPIVVGDPDRVCRYCLRAGYDIPRGTSQLRSIDMYDKSIDRELVKESSEFMKSILYLPITSNEIDDKDLTLMIKAIGKATSDTDDKNRLHRLSQAQMKCDDQSPQMLLFILLLIGFHKTCKAYFHILSIFIILTVGVLSMFCWYPCKSYCDESLVFAKYMGIFNDHQQKSRTANNISIEEDRNRLDLEVLKKSKRALLTGATGYVGSMILRDLLLHRKELGVEAGVVLLTRSKRSVSGEERVRNLLEGEMFSFLSKEEKKCLVSTVEGDVSLPDLGIDFEERRHLKSLNITIVIHCAASVNFTQSLEDAAATNISSALQLQRFAKYLDSKFVYMSTAFVHGELCGNKDKPLPEDLFELGEYDALDIYYSMIGTQSLASVAMNELGFPNTYTFSKCICEHLLLRDKKSDVVIVRPSIVGPAWIEPWEGWAGEIPSTLVAGACLFLKIPNSVWSFSNNPVPVIPVDIVSKFTLSVGFKTNLVNSCLKIIEGSKSCEAKDWPSGLNQKIFNVIWDASSPEKKQFLWTDFGFTTLQLGAFWNYYTRFYAQLFHFIVTNFLWRKNVSYSLISSVHEYVTKLPYRVLLYIYKHIQPSKGKKMERELSMIDLPLLFFPFTQTTFYFESCLSHPDSYDGQRYMASCVLAADLFLQNFKNKRQLTCRQLTRYSIGGNHHKMFSSDIWWALSQPKGNIFIRVIGYVFIKLLRRVCSNVTINLRAFSELAKAKEIHGKHVQIILAPTHKSFFDFLLISYICFAVPELGLEIPFICAADDFAEIPILGRLAKGAKAFFIKRGKGKEPDLDYKIAQMKKHHTASFEVFIEGTRSRDRRFLKPKSGILRCLMNTKENHIILPISISYEKVPEQASHTSEISTNSKRGLLLFDLYDWVKDVFKGYVNLGRIHITASDPLLFTPESDVNTIISDVQLSHQRNVFVSRYHVEATCKVLSLPFSVVVNAMQEFGCNFWDEDITKPTIDIPSCNVELVCIFLQWAHCLSPCFIKSFPKWAFWLNPQGDRYSNKYSTSEATNAVIHSLTNHFIIAEKQVEDVIGILKSRGFTTFTKRHILQYVSKDELSNSFCLAAVEMKLADIKIENADCFSQNNTLVESPLSDSTFLNQEIVREIDRGENFGAWGYRDSGFVLKFDKHGKHFLSMKGKRYNISGRRLRTLIPFLENKMNIKLNVLKTYLPMNPLSLDIVRSEVDESHLTELVKKTTCQVSIDARDRFRHGTGHTQDDMFLLRSGKMRNRRFPDVVIWPADENDVVKIVEFAQKLGWCLIPFGGGTNVTHATWCPTKDIEPRPIASIDMRRMNKVLHVNKEDGIAHVQAGIVGSDLIEELNKYGLTMGHEPDSLEFSTLGGWISTKASGMKRSKYGNIEDLVKDVRVIGSQSLISQKNQNQNSLNRIKNQSIVGRVSTGIDFCSLSFGSEGCLGIITSAKIRVFPLPEIIQYECVVLPSFESGLRFVRNVANMRQLKPASVRLVDNEQFQLGQVLKGDEDSWISMLKTKCGQIFLSLFHDFDKNAVACVSITFEGSKDEVHFQKSSIQNLCSKYGGVLAGERAGKAGYDLTFAIAYLRDFAMTYGCMGESFETFVPWSKVEDLINETKGRIIKEHNARYLPGEALVSCRVTQLYDDGVCVYFYYLMNFEGVQNPVDVYNEIENAARDEILKRGGSLSHHHGVGKLRGKWMETVNSTEVRDIFANLKKGIDPKNIFGARNGTFFENE